MNKIWTDEQLIQAVIDSNSRREVLIKLGLAPQGGNYKTIKSAIERLSLNTTHFNGIGWSKGKTFGPKRDLSEYLNNSFPITSHSLRVRLIKEGVFEKKCSKCNLFEWLGQDIPLELDHIDGDHKNNSIENLRVLCPNCHAQTETYRGKNAKKKKVAKSEKLVDSSKVVEVSPCFDCGSIEKHPKTLRCKKCNGQLPKETKINWPSNEELLDRLSKSNYSRLARELGVSDNAIRKRLRNNA